MDESTAVQDKETSEQTETTSKDTETFTKEQLAEAKLQGKSDGLAEVGRLKKENERLVSASQKLNTRVDNILREQEDAELKAAEGNTEQLSAIRERQARRVKESELDSRTQERDELQEKLTGYERTEAEHTKEQTAREVATRLEVDGKRLSNLAKFTDGSTAAIEEIARDLPKKTEPKDLKIDSNKTIGGKDWERVQETYIKNPEDRQNTTRYLEMRAQQGR